MNTEVNLDNCHREPIHIPGHIQPHGALFGFDLAGTLVHRSANAHDMLLGAVPALGEKLAVHHFSGYEGLHELLAETRESPDGEVIPHAMQVQGKAGVFDVIAHRTASGFICEFEQSEGNVPVPPSFSFMSHRAMERLKREQSVDRLLTVAVEEVRRMTGFDRVMAYRFRHDDSGDVVAEAVCDELDPFIGRRYPASDIPSQARRLYVINTLRLIADVKSVPVPVEALTDAAPLDMSHGVLRSVSPVHIEYLNNMGVGASMSVSIVIGGKLWGMLACHHMQARRVAYTVRMACDVLAQVLASNLQGILARDHAARADMAASLRSRIVEKVLHANNLTGAMAAESEALCKGFGAEGVLVALGQRVESFGGLSLEAATALVEWLNHSNPAAGRMLHLDNFDSMPVALRQQMDVWCGLLALPFGAELASWVVLLRKEQIETVNWGGKPEKETTVGPLGPRLTPRGSFALWREIVRGKAVPWDAVDLDNAQKLLDELVRADAAQVAEVGRARHQLMAMLGHDLRGPIQTISLTATLMERRGGDDQFSRRLQSSSTRMQRLVEQVMDMSRVHGGGLHFDMQPLDLAELMRQMVAEFSASHPATAVAADVPAQLLMHGDGDRIAQVISNLLGNASHHGKPDEPVLLSLRQAGDQAVLEVHNVAAPIDDEMAQDLFQPFKRSYSRNLTNRNGLGLGLYIAHQVVDGHEGTLAYSYAQPHVVFTAAFPLQQALQKKP